MSKWQNLIETGLGELPGGPVIKILPSNAGGVGLIPDWRADIAYASWPKK